MAKLQVSDLIEMMSKDADWDYQPTSIYGRLYILYKFLWKNNFEMTKIVIFSLVSLISGIVFTVLLYQWSPLVTVVLMYLGGFMSALSQVFAYALSSDGSRYQKFLKDNLAKLESLSKD